jgi:hypothetical protein
MPQHVSHELGYEHFIHNLFGDFIHNLFGVRMALSKTETNETPQFKFSEFVL